VFVTFKPTLLDQIKSRLLSCRRLWTVRNGRKYKLARNSNSDSVGLDWGTSTKSKKILVRLLIFWLLKSCLYPVLQLAVPISFDHSSCLPFIHLIRWKPRKVVNHVIFNYILQNLLSHPITYRNHGCWVGRLTSSFSSFSANNCIISWTQTWPHARLQTDGPRLSIAISWAGIS
jgi:hypothetical protein